MKSAAYAVLAGNATVYVRVYSYGVRVLHSPRRWRASKLHCLSTVRYSSEKKVRAHWQICFKDFTVGLAAVDIQTDAVAIGGCGVKGAVSQSDVLSGLLTRPA